MQIEAVPFRHRGDAGDIIGAAGAGAADAGDDAGRQHARLPVGDDSRFQSCDIHGAEAAGNRNAHEIVLTDARHPDRPVDGGVDLIGRIDAQYRLALQALLVALPVERALAHGQHGGERRRRCRILHDAGKPFRQAERLTHPVDDARLEFGRCRRSLPEHALRGHNRDQIFGHHRDRCGIGREIGEEARMLPMRHAGQDFALEVGEDCLHRFAMFRRRDVDASGDFARLDERPHRPFAKCAPVVGTPFGRAQRPFPEFVAIHLALRQIEPSDQRARKTEAFTRESQAGSQKQPSVHWTSRPRSSDNIGRPGRSASSG
ncbi:hypothetical protein [Mesorhizobium sp. WSM2561]|uniref:hypothetical protein n=1 Tax=Mesorhizobium sp. WSM2561 TaxID=1040985 RepID=UPI001FD9807D|nr:hypothetical protein [Mesorhizobium sp. WSM2561]